MAQQLDFMDCGTCGKRVATTALRCAHCRQNPRGFRSLSDLQSEHNLSREGREISDYSSQSHHALEDGGYAEEPDDFDYDAFLESEKLAEYAHGAKRGRVKTWVWVTAWLIIVATLLPFALTLVR